MSAHLRDIYRPMCGSCGNRAVVSLYNTFNAHNGDFCRRHGKSALAAALKREQAAWDAGARYRPVAS